MAAILSFVTTLLFDVKTAENKTCYRFLIFLSMIKSYEPSELCGKCYNLNYVCVVNVEMASDR